MQLATLPATKLTSELSVEESQRLVELETTIEAGFASFVRVGLALIEIRNRRLYRQNFPTFDEYCRRTWGFDSGYAYMLIRSAKAADNLKDCAVQPTKNNALRPLLYLEPSEQRAIWQLASEDGKEPKHPKVYALVRELMGYKRQPPKTPQVTPPAVRVEAKAAVAEAPASEAEWISEISRVWPKIYFGTLNQFAVANRSAIQKWICQWINERATERNHVA
jgi:hypothetical protein